MKHFTFLFFLLVIHKIVAQDIRKNSSPTIDPLYREDQFYIAGTFDIINNLPGEISQTSFSGGLDLGVIRDLPINKRRNLAFGIGGGYSVNVYNQNLLIQDKQSVFRVLTDEDNVLTNRIFLNIVELPIEFRWRSSTPQSYKFWRIYTGVKLGYIHRFRAKFKSETISNLTSKNPYGLVRLRLGT